MTYHQMLQPHWMGGNTHLTLPCACGWTSQPQRPETPEGSLDALKAEWLRHTLTIPTQARSPR